ncbi:MAG: hypothetical protein HWE15_05715 [Algoriphagus sp.]|uniref:hypothetical protein n=1 Tax=Algoriphagus sp. TaxID=1872435 RepID=UPI00182DD965|nr:hypothetical protein [Algoriphagus sp.]NVJ85783.1 hypothetical protein [Algoriphagus sp.]
MDLTDEGLEVNEKGEYGRFDQPFQLINSKYPWFRFHLTKLHEDFRDYVLSELITTLNEQGILPDDLRYSKQDLENSLNAKFEFGNAPLRNGLQNIKVKNLIEVTEYDYQEFTEQYAQEIGQKFKLRGKYKMWVEEQPFYPENMEVLNESNNFETVGKLEVSGNTILIKNEFGQIEFAFPSDKFFVSTTPILSKSKGWFYKSI